MDIYSAIKLICGLTFFLFGMKVMSADLAKLAGGRLEDLLKTVTSKPVPSLLLGAVITIAMQSSSAVTVMLVGLVNSGIMMFSQTLYVIFGANIGTTLTSWILALSGLESGSLALNMLKPENFSPVLAFIGIIMAMFSKNEKKQSAGNVFVGFAVLMYGMVFMTNAVSPLASSPEFTNILAKLQNPVAGVLVGTVITAIIQSSAASIGILQALSLTGAIPAAMAVPIVMGQNIGTCATSLLSAIGATPKAKRVAVVHVSIKIFGTVICLTVFELIYKIFSPAVFSTPVTAWGVAMIHTVFNITITVILIPFTKLLVKLCEKIVPEKVKPAAKQNYSFELDDRLLYTPAIAVNECAAVTEKMCSIARNMLYDSFSCLTDYSADIDATVADREEILDNYEDDIGTYLVKLAKFDVSVHDSKRITGMLHAIGNFERLGDHALNLIEAARELNEKKIIFSGEAKNEIGVICSALEEIIFLTDEAYANSDFSVASRVEPLEQVIDTLTDNAKLNHASRLTKGMCSIEQGFVFSDIMYNFERISDHCSNIAASVIEIEKNEFDTHKYLNSVKHGGGEFDRIFKEYCDKYSF